MAGERRVSPSLVLATLAVLLVVAAPRRVAARSGGVMYGLELKDPGHLEIDVQDPETGEITPVPTLHPFAFPYGTGGPTTFVPTTGDFLVFLGQAWLIRANVRTGEMAELPISHSLLLPQVDPKTGYVYGLWNPNFATEAAPTELDRLDPQTGEITRVANVVPPRVPGGFRPSELRAYLWSSEGVSDDATFDTDTDEYAFYSVPRHVPRWAPIRGVLCATNVHTGAIRHVRVSQVPDLARYDPVFHRIVAFTHLLAPDALYAIYLQDPLTGRTKFDLHWPYSFEPTVRFIWPPSFAFDPLRREWIVVSPEYPDQQALFAMNVDTGATRELVVTEGVRGLGGIQWAPAD